MDSESLSKKAGDISRRRFMRDGAIAAAGLAVGLSTTGCQESQVKAGGASGSVQKIRSYNPQMEYRRLGKTEKMVSAVALGGHWKKLPYRRGTDEFRQNRYDVVSACIECGINYVDACAEGEILAYAEALRGRRGKMYLGYSFCEHEMRFKKWQSTSKLLEGLDDLLVRAKLEYVDLWRITCYWQPDTDHTIKHERAIVRALEKAQKAGKVRFTGISTHKHDWAIRMIKTYPKQIQVVVVPYPAGSRKAHARVNPDGPGGWQSVPDSTGSQDESMLSVIETVKRYNVGWFGIKPFASGSVFKSRGAVNPDTKEIDDERARMTLRYILCNDALTAPIPGMITVDQVRNAAQAVTERRKFDLDEAQRFEEAVDEMWANLPQNYQWLRQEWEYV